MSEQLKLALGVLNLDLAVEMLEELAESHPVAYYIHIVNNLTSDVDHTASYISDEDLTTLEKFVEDVKILRK